MGVTIKDVAKAAGVSPSTVSRVINNNHAISSETRERVVKAMRELNYFPNSIARSFAHQNTCTIGVLIDLDSSNAFTNPFFYEVLHGIETVVYREGYYLIIANDKTMVNQNKSVDCLVLEKRIDGLILPSSVLKRSLVRKLKEKNFPFVVIGEPLHCMQEVDWVDINNVQGGEQAINHLVEKGYRKIAYIGGSQKDIFNRNRISGVLSALEKNGLKVSEDYIREAETTKESGYEVMRQLLRQEDAPDSVICGDSFMAFGVIKAVKEHGLKIPEDFGIVSFDDYPIAQFVEPAITTIDIDVFDLGVQAATVLMKILKMPASRQQQSLISTKVLARDSSAGKQN